MLDRSSGVAFFDTKPAFSKVERMVVACLIPSLYLSTRLGQNSLGRKLMKVSTISNGEGSVGVSALPAFPTTLSTSGKPRTRASLAFRSSITWVTLALGTVTGISRVVPSSSAGMNATPIFGKLWAQTPKAMSVTSENI